MPVPDARVAGLAPGFRRPRPIPAATAYHAVWNRYLGLERQTCSLVVLCLVFAISAAIVWFLRLPWLVANILLLGLPLSYLLLISPTARSRVSPKFTVLFVLFAIVVVDYLNERHGGWSGPTLLPFRFPGGVTIEEILWIVLYFPLILTLNEAFFATGRTPPPRPGAKFILKSAFYATLAFVVFEGSLQAFSLQGLALGPVYLITGLTFFPTSIVLGIAVNRSIIRELLCIAMAAGVLNTVFEFIALELGYWEFHGTYVGTVRFGPYYFPVEELIFLIVLSGPSIVATYAIYKNWRGIGAA